MRRWLPSPLLSASLLLMWLMLNQTLEPAHWLLGGVLGVLAPLLSRPLQPHGHARIRRPLALMRMRNLILMMEKRRPWVSELILKRGRQ